MKSVTWISRMIDLQALWVLVVLIWAALLWILSADSHPPMGPSFPMKDKLLHGLYFTGGTGAFLLAQRGHRWIHLPFFHMALTGMIFAGLIGALDEYHQTFTPGRSGNDPWDWLADICGGYLGAGLLHVALKRWAKDAH
jgi:hypothetical protein